MITLIPVFIASCRATEDKFVRIMPQKVVPHGSNPHRQTVNHSTSNLALTYRLSTLLTTSFPTICKRHANQAATETKLRRGFGSLTISRIWALLLQGWLSSALRSQGRNTVNYSVLEGSENGYCISNKCPLSQSVNLVSQLYQSQKIFPSPDTCRRRLPDALRQSRLIPCGRSLHLARFQVKRDRGSLSRALCPLASTCLLFWCGAVTEMRFTEARCPTPERGQSAVHPIQNG